MRLFCSFWSTVYRLVLVVSVLVLGVGIDTCRSGHFPVPTTTPGVTDFIGSLSINGAAARPGDEVAFFDPDGVLCGLFVVQTAGQFGILHVYGDDTTTGQMDEGARSGDELTIRVWSKECVEEYGGEDVVLNAGEGAGAFQPANIPPRWFSNGYFDLNIATAIRCNGDLNNDFNVNLQDGILALQVTAGFSEDQTLSFFDISEDDYLGLAEIIYILQKVAGLRNN